MISFVDPTYSSRKGKCLCGKIKFDKKTAISKKHFLERKGKERELRVYQCDIDDRNWHLTSLVYKSDDYELKKTKHYDSPDIEQDF